MSYQVHALYNTVYNSPVTPRLCLGQQGVQIPLSQQVYALYSNMCKHLCHTKPMPCTAVCTNTPVTPSLYLVQLSVQNHYHTKSMCHTEKGANTVKSMYCTVVWANTHVIPSLCLVKACVQIPLSHKVCALYSYVCTYPCHTKSIPCTIYANTPVTPISLYMPRTVMCTNTCVISSLCLAIVQ